MGANYGRLVGEGGAAAVEGFGEILDGGEGLVGDGLVGERPQALGGLQLGRIGRQETEADAVGDTQPGAHMPAGIVEHDDDDLVGAGTDAGGESVEHRLEQCHPDPVGEPPLDPAARRVDEAPNIEPAIFVMAKRHRTLAAPRPHTPAERLQPEPMLVEGPYLDRAPGVRGLGPRHLAAEFFLNAARSSALAERA